MRPQHKFPCLLCFNVVGLNCFERKCECKVKFDIWRNTKIISVCIVFQPESISSQQRYSLQPSRYSPCICIVLAPLVLSLLSSEHNNHKSARIHAIHRMIQKSPYIRIWYLRAPLIRTAFSKSYDWSPWKRWVASEVSIPHPTWFLFAGAFECHAVPGETTGYGPSKKNALEICAHNTRCSSPWERKRIRMWNQCNDAHTEHVL
jgi:hypothetical protein